MEKHTPIKMKLTLIRIIILFVSIMQATGMRGNNDGLYFNSHSYPTSERTTLLLNDGKPIKIKDVFRMTFNMDLRKNESAFGNIFCIKTDDGKHIDAIFSMPEEDEYRPGLVVDKRLHHINCEVKAGNNIKVGITFDRKNNKIIYDYSGHKTIVSVDLKQTSAATILFGMHQDEANYVDVAPINVRDINIYYGNKRKFFWNLRQHDGDTCYDSISNAPATQSKGHWIFDDHVKWKTVFAYKSKEKIQITFNPADNIFYIVDNKSVYCFDPVKKVTNTIKVKGGYRAMMYANYIAFSPADNDLYTYNIKNGLISHFNFNTGRWSNENFIGDEPEQFNHAWAAANDTVAYIFGGYGFYKYHNSLYRINSKTGEIRKLDYSPKINPRMGAAAAVVGDKLYIFGGYGNATGEQELPCSYYYDLTCIDLNTLKSETVWTAEGDKETSFQLSAEMIYNKDDNTFLAATTNNSGRLIKISIKEPGWKIVTDFIGEKFQYKDLSMNLYNSIKDNKIYVVINKRLNNLEHDIKIYSIDRPIQDNYIVEKKENKAGGPSWLWLLLLIIPAGGILIYYKKRADRTNDKTEMTATADTEAAKKPETGLHLEEEKEEKDEEHVKYYTPDGGYISILGKFIVRNRDGEDITSQFTRRTRNLLLMLLLHSEKNSKGIEIHRLDEALWQEMNEEAARNNRNVYMRKLRILLEKVGNMEITNDKIYYRINLGNDVFFDYHEALAMMNRMKEEEDDKETTARTLELLFEGPILPNYSFEWLDKFKADYSNAVISLLTGQMNREIQKGNDSMAMKIAETIMMHDPFSEKALATQCSILCKRHKRGLAKNVYDNFCKNYETCIGEKYNLSFAEVCK